MKNLKVLQVASYYGNIGDNANIFGTRRMLKNNLDFKLLFTDLEIRRYFRNELKFDHNFVELANKHDLVIIGGGNFFELWVDKSCNSTSIDIPINILNNIKSPLIFYGLGFDDGMGISKNGINKFETWLENIIGNNNILLTLRNDGSLKTAQKYLKPNYTEKFKVIPDGGFFIKTKDTYTVETGGNRKYIGINIAGDMLDIRFKNYNEQYISYKDFLEEFVEFVNYFLNENQLIDIVFYPHIFKDFYVITDIFKNLTDKHVRNRITVAPYVQGFLGFNYIFNSYKKCDVILGNRFHSNVCGISLNIPTIGLVNYPQIQKLYEELDITNMTLHINKKHFAIKLNELIYDTLNKNNKIRKKYSTINKSLKNSMRSFHAELNNWLINIHQG